MGKLPLADHFFEHIPNFKFTEIAYIDTKLSRVFTKSAPMLLP